MKPNQNTPKHECACFFIPNAVTGKSHAHSEGGQFCCSSAPGPKKMCKAFAYHCMKVKDGYSFG